PEKFLGWIHRPVLLMVKLRRTSPRGEIAPHIRKPQPAQGQFTPRHPLLLVDRLLREMSAFAHSLLIRILGIHGARSDLRTPPLWRLGEMGARGRGRKGPAGGGEAAVARTGWAGGGGNSHGSGLPGGTRGNYGGEPNGRERSSNG